MEAPDESLDTPPPTDSLPFALKVWREFIREKQRLKIII